MLDFFSLRVGFTTSANVRPSEADKSPEGTSKSPAGTRPRLFRTSKEEDKSALASSKRRRPRCASEYAMEVKGEDSIAFHEVMKGEDHLCFICVADGHGGTHTSMWLSHNILDIIVHEAADGSSQALQGACRHAFAKAHEEVKTIVLESEDSEREPRRNTSGSTLTVVILNHTRREVRQRRPCVAPCVSQGWHSESRLQTCARRTR